MDIDKLTLFVKPISTDIYKSDVREEVSKIPGFVSIHMSEPIKKQGFIRYCWVVFEDEASFSHAAAVLNGLVIKNTELSVSKSSSKNRRVRVLKHYPKSRVGLDCRTCHALIKTLDNEEGVLNNPLT
jgi:RNA recognition motif-containing protein